MSMSGPIRRRRMDSVGLISSPQGATSCLQSMFCRGSPRAYERRMTTMLFWLLLLPLNQQEQLQGPVSDAAAPTPVRKPTKPAAPKDKASNDRLFFTLPNYFTLEKAGDAPPLTAADKFKMTARGAFDPMQVAFIGIQTGIGDAQGHDSGYGAGVEGYSKRLAVHFADSTIENFMTRAIMPTVLHEDPRYYQKGSGGFWRRSSYAVSRIFVTRTDSGATTFNFSEILGSGSAASISAYSYHLPGDHNLGSVASIWGTQVAYDALSYWLKEFWPDLRRKVTRHHADATPAPGGALHQ